MSAGAVSQSDENVEFSKAFESRDFLNSFTEGMVIHDLQGKIVDANVAASQLLGISHDQLLGCNPRDPPWHSVKEDGSDFRTVEHPAMTTLRTQQPCVGVIMGIDAPPATRRWLKISSYPLEVDGRLVGVSALFEDVTNLIDLRDELRSTNERLEILSQHPADVVVLASQDAVGEWASDSITELLGWSPEDVVGQRIDFFVHPDDRTTLIDARQFGREAPSASIQVRLRRKDGQYRWIAIRARRFTDALTHESRIVSSWRDVQSLVESHEELEKSEARFRFLAENASDIVGETDAQFNITWLSPSAFDILGWRPDALVGTAALDLVFPEDRPKFLYEAANLVAGLNRAAVKIRFVTASGSPRWMLNRAHPKFDTAGRTVAYILTMRDIHDEETVRGQLEASEQRYRLLAENGADMIILVGADDTYQWVSPSATELLGWLPQEMVGKGPRDFVHPDDLAKIYRAREHMSGDTFSIDALRYRNANGEYRWVSGRGRTLFDDSGAVSARVISQRDVTKQVDAERKLSESETLFRLVLNNSRDVTLKLSLGATVEWASPSVFKLIGWRPEEIVGRQVTEFINTADLEGLSIVVDNVAAGHLDEYMTRVHTIAGDEKWVAAKAQPLLDEFGTTSGSVVNVRDVTAEIEVRTQLAQSEELFRLAMSSAPIGMAVIDLDRRFVAVNRAMTNMTGRSEEWLLTHAISDVLDEEDDQLDVRMHARALSGHVIHAEREMCLQLLDGSTVWVEHAIGLLRDQAGMPQSIVSTFVDVTERRADREKLRYQATHDALTHLVNRRDLYVRAEALRHETLRSGEWVGVLYIDVDAFKVVNDTLGHHVGDLALKAVAERLATVGRIDDVVSRVGGDEFVLLLPALHTVEDAQHVAKKILDLMEEPVVIEGESIALGVSIGVALARPGESADDTLRRADAALYAAKSRGRGQSVVWDPSLE